MSDETTTEATEATTPEGGRGRPRPSATLERDEKVFEFLSTGGKTRPAVAEAFELSIAEAYLSLARLRTDGRVKSERRNGKMTWYRPDVVEPEVTEDGVPTPAPSATDEGAQTSVQVEPPAPAAVSF